jgi:hypothetical protein
MQTTHVAAAFVCLLLLSACAQQTPTAITPTSTPAVTILANPTDAPAVLPSEPAAVASLTPAAADAVPPAPAATPTLASEPTLPPAPPTPSGPVFTQLTNGGCCVQPFFSPDGSRALFLDRPSGAQPVGIYGVPVAQPGQAPTLLIDKLGPFSRDLSHRALLVNGQTQVERVADGQTWPIDNGGRSVSFSPDAKRLIWSVSEEAGGFDRRKSDLFVANIDGSGARRVVTRFGGGAVAWFDDGVRILIGGRAQRGDPLPSLAVLNLDDGSVRDLFTAERWRGVLLAPGGRHAIYFIAQARELGIGGTYLVNIDKPEPQRMDFFGSYRWRDATRLLYVPLTADATANELWQYDLETGQSTRLIAADPASPFKIGNGDWDVSSDGQRLLWVNARDRNIWTTVLPE